MHARGHRLENVHASIVNSNDPVFWVHVKLSRPNFRTSALVLGD